MTESTMTKLGVPFIKYVLGPVLAAGIGVYTGKKSEQVGDKSYEVVARAINVELQMTLEQLDARLDTLDARMLRAETNLLMVRATELVAASQPVAVAHHPRPPKKPQVPPSRLVVESVTVGPVLQAEDLLGEAPPKPAKQKPASLRSQIQRVQVPTNREKF